jgi:hypothetical protein
MIRRTFLASLLGLPFACIGKGDGSPKGLVAAPWPSVEPAAGRVEHIPGEPTIGVRVPLAYDIVTIGARGLRGPFMCGENAKGPAG